MQNRWFIFILLFLMFTALFTLAFLQYKWLGSVSEAEKERLEESIAASSENFVTDFGQVFTNLQNNFRIQLTKGNVDITSKINERYIRWRTNFNHHEVLKEILFINVSEDFKEVKYFTYYPTKSKLSEIDPDSATRSWVEKNIIVERENSSRISLNTLPKFGKETFMKIPLQRIDFFNSEVEKAIKHLVFQINRDDFNDFMLLRIDNNYIKSTLIPEVAAKYFGESFDEQYQLSVLKTGDNPFVYFNSLPEILPENPDHNIEMDRMKFSSMIFFENQFKIENEDPTKIDSTSLNVLEINSESKNTRIKSISRFDQNFIYENDTSLNSIAQFSVDITPSTIDTTFSASFMTDLSSDNLELWLSFKEGSLEAFVQKTKRVNLAISFGILSVLGIGCLLIVIFAQRLKDLADKQMLFVTGVSHELRTPISVIRSAAENLSEGVVTKEERKKEYAKLMLKEGKRLSDMVDQIMEFSGIQSGQRIYNFSDIDIENLMNNILNEFKPIFFEHSLTLEYINMAKLNVIRADQNALFVAISNLIQNALKFVGNSQKIVLRVDETSFKSGLALRIQVQDYGVGIPKDEQKDVFKPFYRTERSVKNQIKGNGIGLSLVERIATVHHGAVTLKSEEGNGSTFSLLIPYHL